MGEKNVHRLGRGLREPASYALGGIIRELREQRGWSWGDLSDRCGLSRQGLIFIESNERLASVETAERIGQAFGLPGSALMALAEQRAGQWPAACKKCNYCCVAFGVPKHLDGARGCIRPAC